MTLPDLPASKPGRSSSHTGQPDLQKLRGEEAMEGAPESPALAAPG